MRLASVALVICSTASVASAGNGFAALVVPPAEVDFGTGNPLGSAPAVTGASQELLAGVHWASLYWKPTTFDLGVGYVGVWRPVVPGYAARSTTPSDQVDNVLHVGGAYIDMACTLDARRHWRTWFAGRVEYLSSHVNGQQTMGHGAAVRIATEVFGSGVHGVADRGAAAVAAGTWALGFYVEASHRTLAPELGPNSLTAGFSLRIPFIAGIAG
jgi:hypothetical protein